MTPIGTYRTKALASHALSMAGYERKPKQCNIHFDVYAKNKHKLFLVWLSNTEWEVRE